MCRLTLVAVLGLALAASLSPPALACPLCREAVPNSSGTEEEDQARLALAYNRSIYLMVGMPYLLVGAMSYLIYRQIRLRAALESRSFEPTQPLSPGSTLSQLPGDQSCDPPSRAGVS